MLLCVGVGGALLTLAGEHGFYRLILPHIRRRQNLKYWLHTSQVSLELKAYLETSSRPPDRVFYVCLTENPSSSEHDLRGREETTS